MATTVEECKEICELVERTGLKYMMAEVRFDANTELVGAVLYIAMLLLVATTHPRLRIHTPSTHVLSTSIPVSLLPYVVAISIVPPLPAHRFLIHPIPAPPTPTPHTPHTHMHINYAISALCPHLPHSHTIPSNRPSCTVENIFG